MSQKTRTLKATARSSSFNGVKRVKSLFSKMKITSFDQSSEPESPRTKSGPGIERKSIVPKTGKMGPICNARKKTAEVIAELVEQEEIDLDEQFGKERCSDDQCMWLTSDSSSPAYFFEEYRLSSSLHVSVDEWMISWLSTLANSYVHLDKASSISDKSRELNPDQEDASSERTEPDFEMILQEDLKEEKRLSLVSKSCRRKIEFSVSSSESSSSNFEHCCGNLTSSDDSAAPPSSTTFDSPSCSSRTSDLDGMSFSVSLLSLDGDDSKWTSDTELESDILRSSFPSPSCWRSWSSEAFSSSSNVSTPGKFQDGHLHRDLSLENSSSEAEVLKDFNTDGPLFWPFDKKLDWNSEEDWKCFAMSPRKDKLSISPQRISSKSVEMKFHDSRVLDSKMVCRRRLVFSSGSAASNIMEKKQRRDNNSSTKKMNSMPSRLKKSIKDGRIPTPKVDSGNTNLSQDDFASNRKLPIEILLGLDEFDGHEGVDSEFNEGVFSLDDSL